MSQTIQSNSISGSYKDEIISRTLDEIYRSIKSVYGPYGTDVFIKKNGQIYYTRDGKEVLGSISFNNPLSKDILSIMYQAVEKQARTAGDGTTTLILLYINLYKIFKSDEYLELLRHYPTSDVRREYDTLMKDLVKRIKDETVSLNDDTFKSMLFTCTQDPELSMTIFNTLRNDLSDDEPYIIVSQSDFVDELTVERNERPIIPCMKLYSFKATTDVFTSKNARILYVDGPIDIANAETISLLLHTDMGNASDIIVLGGGITEATRKALIDLKSDESIKANMDKLNNLIFMRIDNYSTYPKIYKEDLSSFIYNIEELEGITNNISFEAYLFKGLIGDLQLFIDQCKLIDAKVPDIVEFDASQKNIDRLIYALSTPRNIEYSIGDGLKIDSELTEISKKRYDAIKKELADEKSEVRRQELIRRIRKIFGVFIEVKVGSQLLKDSQRKFELILDAVISSQEGFKKGVLLDNSLIVATRTLTKIRNESSNQLRIHLCNLVIDSILSSLADLVDNKHNYFETSKKFNKLGLMTKIRNDVIENPTKVFNLRNENGDIATEVITEKDGRIDTSVVEPYTIIETLMLNSTTAADMALSKIFVIDGFIGNYI